MSSKITLPFTQTTSKKTSQLDLTECYAILSDKASNTIFKKTDRLEKIEGSNLHHGREVTIRTPLGLRLLSGFELKPSFNSAAIALSYLQTRHRKNDTFSAWALLLSEQRIEVMSQFITVRLNKVRAIGHNSSDIPIIFQDVIQCRTHQADALLESLGILDENLSISMSKGWENLSPTIQMQIALSLYAFIDSISGITKYREVVTKRVREIIHLENKGIAIPSKLHKKYCRLLHPDYKSVPIDVRAKRIHPKAYLWEVWTEETKRNRKVLYEISTLLKQKERI